MRIVPAVDIRGGLCVNLVQGDYDRETVFSKDPVAQARTWRELGGAIIHVVDLDGAKAGHCCIEPQLRALAKEGIPFEVGGGIRSMETVSLLVDLGAQRIIIGTAAHKAPGFLRNAVAAHPRQIVVGIDAKAGKVALSGWLDVTETLAIDFAKQIEQAGVSRIIYTDILSDGMMKGPDLEATRLLAQAVGIPVTASGGMSSLDDIRAVARLEAHGVDEVIIGRALYLDIFTLPQAIAVANQVP